MDELMVRDAKIIDITGCKVTDKELLCKLLGVSKEHIERYPNWYFVNGKLCYFKSYVLIKKTINELLGEELCKIFDLPCVHYEIAYNGEEFGLLSENIKVKNMSYLTGADFDLKSRRLVENFDYFKSRITSIKSLELLKRMIVNDFHSLQTDREKDNILFLDLINDVRLAPLLDFEKSFARSIKRYISDIFYFDLDNIEDVEFFKADDYFMYLFNMAYNTDVREVLYRMYEERGLRVDPYYTNDYAELDFITKTEIKKKILC